MKKLNNKGFSLVELIIVIAIMAILVGVVGTQVIPYLENSRKAKDQQVISSWNTAAMSAYSNAAAKIDATANYTIEISNAKKVATLSPNGTTAFNAAVTAKDATGTATTKGCTEIEQYFRQLTGMDVANYDINKMESKAGKDIKEVVIKISADGSIVTETTCTDSKYFFDPIEN